MFHHCYPDTHKCSSSSWLNTNFFYSICWENMFTAGGSFRKPSSFWTGSIYYCQPHIWNLSLVINCTDPWPKPEGRSSYFITRPIHSYIGIWSACIICGIYPLRGWAPLTSMHLELHRIQSNVNQGTALLKPMDLCHCNINVFERIFNQLQWKQDGASYHFSWGALSFSANWFSLWCSLDTANNAMAHDD